MPKIQENNPAYAEAIRRIEFCRMKSERRLNLSGLGLSALPPEIGNLTALRVLYLFNNRLRTLPPEVGKLSALTTLHLANNNLSTLPTEIGNLVALTKLYLAHNQLSTLPPEIGELTALTELYLHDNPGLGVPPEVLGPTYFEVLGSVEPAPPMEILLYYFGLATAQRQGKTKPLNEAKVLFLGQPESGKSSLIHALTVGCPTPNFPKTDGIARCEWKFKVRDGIVVPQRSRGAETLRLNLWDFGGQEIYKATHTYFLTRRAVYVIVTTARKDTSMDSDLEEWLETARTFGGGAPVWFVINKHDENPTGGPDETALIRKYHPMLRGFIRTQCQHAHSGPDKGTGAGRGIDELRNTLVTEAWAMPEVRQEMSAQALSIKHTLERYKKPTLTVDEYREICRKLGETSEGLQSTLLDLWDKLGTVRYFPDGEDDAPSMKETAILNPEWVTEAVYKLLGDPELKAANGLVRDADLDRILKTLKHPAGSYHLIANVMRRFSQLYDAGDGRMFIPQMLEDREPEVKWPTDSLRFVYEYPVLPAGLIPSFIAKMHLFHSILVGPWRRGCVLELQYCRVRVIGDKKLRQVEISVVDGQGGQRRDALDQVRFKFEELHRGVTGMETLKELIPVPRHPDAPMLDYRFLRTLEDEGEATHRAPVDGKASASVRVSIAEALGSVRGAAMKAREDEIKNLTIDYSTQNIHIDGNAQGNAFGKKSRTRNEGRPE